MKNNQNLNMSVLNQKIFKHRRVTKIFLECQPKICRQILRFHNFTTFSLTNQPESTRKSSGPAKKCISIPLLYLLFSSCKIATVLQNCKNAKCAPALSAQVRVEYAN